jgi:hypothetical protein
MPDEPRAETVGSLLPTEEIARAPHLAVDEVRANVRYRAFLSRRLLAQRLRQRHR